MSDMRDTSLTLELAQAMVGEFEDYLLGDSLYRQLRVETSVGTRMPNMSAGSLLEALRDLEYAQEMGELTSEESDRLDELTSEFERLTKRYASAYREKLAWEMKSQIDSWRWFLQDCEDSPSQCRDEYPVEVRIRTRIALLVDTLGEHAPPEQMTRLRQLDRELREILAPGGFILESGLRDRYPKSHYWWLYGYPDSDQASPR